MCVGRQGVDAQSAIRRGRCFAHRTMRNKEFLIDRTGSLHICCVAHHKQRKSHSFNCIKNHYLDSANCLQKGCQDPHLGVYSGYRWLPLAACQCSPGPRNGRCEVVRQINRTRVTHLQVRRCMRWPLHLGMARTIIPLAGPTDSEADVCCLQFCVYICIRCRLVHCREEQGSYRQEEIEKLDHR